jgi:hypothetical protein
MLLRILKTDDEKRMVFGEVYAPNVLDSQGEMMTADDVELMAHRFMTHQSLKTSIDTAHDGVSNSSYPVESFIAPENHPDDYTPGAWVLGVKIADDEIWAAVKRGDLNAFSFEAYCKKQNQVADIDILTHNVGETEACEDHTHLFFVELDDNGKVVKGTTSTTNEHSHEIKRGTATEDAAGHKHRYFC